MRNDLVMAKKESFIWNLISVIIFILLFSIMVIKTFPLLEKKYIYPVKYSDEVLFYCNEYNLDANLVFSVIKTESSFNERAESEKGAKGLMQITDNTAEYIAKLLGVIEYDVYLPKTNIRFGCFYLRLLLDKFGSEKTALCAYNAGEGNVAKWLKNNQYSIDGVELSFIPYKETEEYIRKIYKSWAKYEKLYGNILDKSKKFE